MSETLRPKCVRAHLSTGCPSEPRCRGVAFFNAEVAMRNVRSRSLLCVFVGSCVVLGAWSSSRGVDDASEAGVGASHGDDLKLADVQRAIREQHANWTAGDTTYSALSRSDRKTMLGVPLSRLSSDRVRVKGESDLAPEAAAPPATFD